MNEHKLKIKQLLQSDDKSNHHLAAQLMIGLNITIEEMVNMITVEDDCIEEDIYYNFRGYDCSRWSFGKIEAGNLHVQYVLQNSKEYLEGLIRENKE
jgi:hypothetical protein